MGTISARDGLNAVTGFSTNHYQQPQGYEAGGPTPGGSTSIEDCDNEHQSPDEHCSWFVLKLTLTSALGGFLFGYDTGVVSGAMLLIKDTFSLDRFEQSVVVSITILGAVVASIAGGIGMERLGRRPVILTAAVIFTLGAVLLAAARSYAELLMGRLVVGLGIGLASLATPVYISEAAPRQLRGRLVTLNTLFITGGQVVASVVDGLLAETPGGWRYMLGLSGLPSLLMTIGFLSLPESPRWLVAAGRRMEALAALQTIRGTTDVHTEVDGMVGSASDHSLNSGVGLRATATVRDLLQDPRIRRALVLGCGLQILQQLSGINTVMYFSATIFSMAGFTMDGSIWLAALTAASQSVGVCFGLYFIEDYGRRPLVLSSLSMVRSVLCAFRVCAFVTATWCFVCDSKLAPNRQCHGTIQTMRESCISATVGYENVTDGIALPVATQVPNYIAGCVAGDESVSLGCQRTLFPCLLRRGAFGFHSAVLKQHAALAWMPSINAGFPSPLCCNRWAMCALPLVCLSHATTFQYLGCNSSPQPCAGTVVTTTP